MPPGLTVIKLTLGPTGFTFFPKVSDERCILFLLACIGEVDHLEKLEYIQNCRPSTSLIRSVTISG